MFGRTEPQGEWKLRVPRDRTGSPAGKAGFWGGRSGRGAVFPHLLLACSCVQLASDVAGFGFRGIPKLVLAHWRVGLDPRMAGWLLVNQRYFRPEVTCLWAGWSLGVLRPWSACWCVDWILRRQARGLLRPCSWCILVAKWAGAHGVSQLVPVHWWIPQSPRVSAVGPYGPWAWKLHAAMGGCSWALW